MASITKVCFKCEKSKALSDFYKHSEMADGHLNKCKECTRKDVNQNRSKNHNYYIWSDRIRANDPDRVAARKAYSEKHRGLSRDRKKQWAERNTEKRRAHNLVAKAIARGILKHHPCEMCGLLPADAHHDDYSKPLEVRWLCKVHHGEHHQHMNWFGKPKIAEEIRCTSK